MSRIVIIEDDRSLRKLMEKAIRNQGHVVESTENGREGEKMIRAAPPDLILLDVMLPGKNGLDICESLKESPKTKHVPILMLTCLTEMSQKPDEYWRKRTGADDFISKPFEIRQLLERVEHLLN